MTSALQEMGGLNHTLTTSSPGNRPGTHCTGCWLDLRVGVDDSTKSCPHQHLNPRPSTLKWVTILTMLLWRPLNMNWIC